MLEDANLEVKSMTSVIIMFAQCCILDICQRQRSNSPDVHFAELQAAVTGFYALLPIRGLCHEFRIAQTQPTPIWGDSQSTEKCAKSAGSLKRSIYLLRKVKVLQEATEEGIIAQMHICEADNSADVNTKYINQKQYAKHTKYANNCELTRSDEVLDLV